MTVRNLIAVIVALAVVAAAVMFLFYEPVPSAVVPSAVAPTPRATSEQPLATDTSSPAQANASIVDDVTADGEARIEAATAAVPPTGPLAHITGRCVNTHGQPLAGCKVQLLGSLADDTRREAWLRDHTELPTWHNPDAVVTTNDGRFALAFWPPPPLRFAVNVTLDGHTRVTARWSELAPNASHDLGDLVLAPGVRVRGRVIDTRGVAQAKEWLSISLQHDQSASDDRAVRMRSASARTTDDGTFEMTGWLAPGLYSVTPQQIPLVSPAQVELSLDHPDQQLEIVVQSLADIPRITGRVLDGDGRPVEGAEVRSDSSRFGAEQESHYARTQHDGSFDLRARQPPKGKSIGLVVQAGDCECDPAPRDVAWGSTDVEFRVVRGGLLTVRVTDPQGQPVERYAVRMIARSQNLSSDNGEVRSKGHHDDGVATVAGLTRGDWLVAIEFPGQMDLDMLLAPLQLEAPAPVRLDLVARPPNERPLRVLLSDGTPAVGSTVWLCDAFGTPMYDYRAIMQMEQWQQNASNPMWVLALRELRTDADGNATLRGPAGRDLVLEVTSEHHLPQRLEGVRLDTAAELVVRVSAGATLSGRAGPPEAFAELRRLAGLEPGSEFGHKRPSLSLRAAQGHARFPSATAVMAGRENPLQLGDDGAFATGGIPPGAWLVDLQYWGETSTTNIQVGEVTLTDGTATQRDIDLSTILPGTLEGTIRHNGAPLANHRVVLKSAGTYNNLVTDADGHFTLRAIAGMCTCEIQLDGSSSIQATTSIEIVRGETRRGDFDVFSGRARLHLLDPDGQPVSQVRLLRRDVVRPNGYFLPITDVDGRVTLDLPPGRYTLHALPKKLTGREELQRIALEARNADRENTYGPHLLLLGEVTLLAGDDREVELHLPAAWRD